MSSLFFASAQTIESVYGFTNSFGVPRTPEGGLIFGPDGNLYGVANGGTQSFGTVYRITTSGNLTVLTNLNSATGLSPISELELGPEGNFYGVTQLSGPHGAGTLFRVTASGAVTVLFAFRAPTSNGAFLTNQDGSMPQAGLRCGPDGNFYGTTTEGGAYGRGTIFKITTNGDLTTLYVFSRAGVIDGIFPRAAMTVGPDGALYGTTYIGGTNSASDGIVFRMTTNGVFTKIADFNGANGSNPEGAMLVGPDGNLYGTTVNGGSGGDGTVFKLTTNGMLTTFVPFDSHTGASPMAGLTFGLDGYFYGTLSGGGYATNSGGAVFRVATDGALTILANFSSTNGYQPQAPLTLGPDGNFYGTTPRGGPPDVGSGVVYRFNLARPPTNKLLGISLDAGGIATLNVSSTPGSTNRLWVTTNASLPMAQWEVIRTNIATNGTFQFTDPDTVGKPIRFYRVSTP